MLSRDFQVHLPPTPIDDLDQRASHKKYSPGERDARKKLASLYRLTNLLGWSGSIYSHITCRIPGKPDQYLVHAFGMLYHEITASSLIAVGGDGKIVDQGSTNFGYLYRTHGMHHPIHAARPDVNCIVHLHVPEVVAASSIKDGFLPVSVEGGFLGPVPTFEHQCAKLDPEEQSALVKTLGDRNAMLIKNHGFITCGLTVEEAFVRAHFLVYNLKAQAFLGNLPKSSLHLPTPLEAKLAEEGLKNGVNSGVDSNGGPVHWNFGELDWQAWMRLLDSMGMKTGHEYKVPLWKE